MIMKVLGAVLALVVVAVPNLPRAVGTDKERVRIEQTIGLKYPYTVEKWAHYRDGGSTGVELHGAQGTRYWFGFQGGQRLTPEMLRTGSWRAPRPMYVGSLYPRSPSAHAVAIGGPEEAAVRDVLSLYVDREEPLLRRDMSQQGLTDSQLKNRGQDFGEIGERYRRVTGARAIAEKLDRRVRLGAASDSLGS